MHWHRLITSKQGSQISEAAAPRQLGRVNLASGDVNKTADEAVGRVHGLITRPFPSLDCSPAKTPNPFSGRIHS
jgi:hypothetical protein